MNHRPRFHHASSTLPLALGGALLLALGGCSSQTSTALAPPSSRVQRATDLGPVSPDLEIDIVVGLTLSDGPGLNRFLREKPAVGGTLSPAQFADRFAPSPADYQRVVAWLRKSGVSITRVTDGRTTVSAHGTAAAIEAAFGTSLHQYQDGGGTFFAASASLQIAPEVAGQVSGVVGLSGTPGWHTHYTKADPRAAGDALGATDLQKMYNNTIANPGKGETVALLGTGYGPDPTVDVLRYAQTFLGASGTIDYVQQQVGGVNRDPTTLAQDEEIENALDVDMVLSMASQAHIVHVLTATNAPGLFTDGIAYIVNELPMAHAVSVSYGLCERQDSADMPVVGALFAQAQAEGQQWFVSSGDSGTDTCSDGAGNTHISVDWPASDPHVVGVGGTQLTTTGAEIAWDENATSVPAGRGPNAGGGGPSEFFAKPAYQVGVSPDDGARDTPDVAALAGTPGVNVNTFNQVIAVNGTSASSPLWAGVWALVDQANGGAGITDGLTKLYAVKGAGFNDITMGDNGGPDDKSGDGYQAGVGYDLATGWGTPNVATIVTSIKK
jgi:kumamolisin